MNSKRELPPSNDDDQYGSFLETGPAERRQPDPDFSVNAVQFFLLGQALGDEPEIAEFLRKHQPVNYAWPDDYNPFTRTKKRSIIPEITEDHDDL